MLPNGRNYGMKQSKIYDLAKYISAISIYNNDIVHFSGVVAGAKCR